MCSVQYLVELREFEGGTLFAISCGNMRIVAESRGMLRIRLGVPRQSVKCNFGLKAGSAISLNKVQELQFFCTKEASGLGA